MPHHHCTSLSLGMGEREVKIMDIFRIEVSIKGPIKILHDGGQVTAVDLGFREKN